MKSKLIYENNGFQVYLFESITNHCSLLLVGELSIIAKYDVKLEENYIYGFTAMDYCYNCHEYYEKTIREAIENAKTSVLQEQLENKGEN